MSVRKFGKFLDLQQVDETAPLDEDNKSVAFISYDNGNKYGEEGNAFFIAMNDSLSVTYKDTEYHSYADFPQELKDILESEKDNDDIIRSNGKVLEILSDNDLAYSCAIDYKADMTNAEMYEIIARCINEYENEDVVPATYDEYLIEAIAKEGFDVDVAKAGDSVSVTCYGITADWDNRNEAILYYAEGLNNSEGSEKERYSNIVWGLIDGDKKVADYPEDEPYKKSKDSKRLEK